MTTHTKKLKARYREEETIYRVSRHKDDKTKDRTVVQIFDRYFFTISKDGEVATLVSYESDDGEAFDSLPKCVMYKLISWRGPPLEEIHLSEDFTDDDMKKPVLKIKTWQ